MNLSSCCLTYCLIAMINICVGQGPCVPLAEYQLLQRQLDIMTSIHIMTMALGVGSGVILGQRTALPAPSPVIVQTPVAATSDYPTSTPCPTTASCPTTTPCPTCNLQTELDSCRADILEYNFCAQIGNTLNCNNSGRCTHNGNNCVPIP